MEFNNTNASVIPTNEFSLFNAVMDNSQLVMCVVGFLANLTTLITLMTHGKGFGETIGFLLKHQSAIDAVACAFAGILLVAPPRWVPGVYILDTIICQLWHGQAIYWISMYVSVYNIILIAYERYLCVCRPFKFQEFTLGSLYRLIALEYFLSVLFNVGSFLQTRMREDGCKSEYLWDGPSAKWFFPGYAISVFITMFIIPNSCFIGLYGAVILTFRKRRQAQNLGASGASQVIDKATSELTKTAFVVTIIFVIALGYDCWYYLLGYLGVIEYVLNSPVQKIGVWLATFNSFANPFVYALFMPSYRKAVVQTFSCMCRRKKNEENSA